MFFHVKALTINHNPCKIIPAHNSQPHQSQKKLFPKPHNNQPIPPRANNIVGGLLANISNTISKPINKHQ